MHRRPSLHRTLCLRAKVRAHLLAAPRAPLPGDAAELAAYTAATVVWHRELARLCALRDRHGARYELGRWRKGASCWRTLVDDVFQARRAA